ncbi:hypothetical protein [Neobacillus sp. LXY-4]|uniref:hypothetical protein n=1 Tax=Neobacillus sp. LXY-4 TaxID=3379826 RepID=UPI003EE0CAA7
MFDKKKLNFWRLAVIYIGMTATILLLLWSSPFKSQTAMMGSSMGSMMKGMHASDTTIYSLLSNPVDQQQQMNGMAGHHENSPVYNIGVLTTGTIFLLLPLIIGGSIILAIIWIK